MIKRLGVGLCLLVLLGAASASDKAAADAMMGNERRAKTYADNMTATTSASHYAEEQVAAGKVAYVVFVRAAADCADMAAVTAKLTARGSPMAGHAAGALAKCCAATMAEGEKLNDPALTSCMEHCKKTMEAAEHHETAPAAK